MNLPLILAGPLVRRVEARRLTLWWVSPEPLRVKLELKTDQWHYHEVLTAPALQIIPVGQRAFVHCASVVLDPPHPENPLASGFCYQLYYRPEQAQTQQRQKTQDWQCLTDQLPHLHYATETDGLNVPFSARLREVWHGSCRKPHYPSEDGLVAADQELARRFNRHQDPPRALFMTGDQVYVDDLCGPMLQAVHQVIAQLGLYAETFPQDPEKPSPFVDSQALYTQNPLYGRRKALPSMLAENRWSRLFYRKTALITSQYCDNHLITFAEIFALYLLSWSPGLWQNIDWQACEAEAAQLAPAQQLLYAQEKEALDTFIAGLPQVQRLLAHLPTYMIFDDHDVTDDWNLSEAWENAVYGHPFSRRIIGNALMAYWICQGWGNDPAAFEDQWQEVLTYAHHPTQAHQEAWIDHLLRFQRWDYHLDTEPFVVVLDTRTRRWPSRHQANLPSGLMDRAALQDTLSQIKDREAVILVSAAPVFGLKWIETLQQWASSWGLALAVDAENWMAHGGTARTFLNLLSAHSRRITLLSGDVHYSFVYDVVLRFRDVLPRGSHHGPRIWQITASGFKNAFPQRLLNHLAQTNRWMYHPLSPLNLLTKRRNLWVQPRQVTDSEGNRTEALSHPGIGQVRFNEQGKPVHISIFDQHQSFVFEEP